jgi:thioredoxin reductase
MLTKLVPPEQVACIEKRGTLGGTCLNVGCIPSKSLLNNSHLYHQILHDTKNRGIEVNDVKLNLANLMKAKDTSVAGLTKGVEFLFKKNGVEYLKGAGSFVNEHEIKVELNDGGETSVVGKNILIATGSEATPFPGLEIDEKRVVSSTGAIALEKVPEKMIVIGGGIIGLEMASVWSRLGSKVTVVEFLNQIGGPGMDSEIAKQTQKILKKQGIDFKLSTKVVDGDKSGETIKLNVDAAKGGKAESVGVPRALLGKLGTTPAPAGVERQSRYEYADQTVQYSSMPTSSWLPLAVGHIRQAWAWRTLAWSSTSADVSSSTRSTGPSSPTSGALETPPSDPCWPTRPRRRLLLSSSTSRRATVTSTTDASRRLCTRTPRSHGWARASRTSRRPAPLTALEPSPSAPTRVPRRTWTRTGWSRCSPTLRRTGFSVCTLLALTPAR